MRFSLVDYKTNNHKTFVGGRLVIDCLTTDILSPTIDP